MAERRSLAAALNLTPEQEAFVNGGRSSPPKGEMALKAGNLPQPEAVAAAPADPEIAERAEPERSLRRSRSRRHARAQLPQGEGIPFGMANLLMPLTTRLQPSTAAALKRAGLEQKLHGQSPGTVQEIVEEAIQDWLRDSGYLT
jgi:hypothetical protein